MGKKITKKTVLEAIVNANLEDVDFGEEVTVEDVVAFAENEIKILDKRDAKKKEKVDELYDAVAATLTEEYKTIAQIVDEIEGDFEELTAGKVTSRLTKLRKNGLAHKKPVKNGNRTVNGYAAGPEPEVEETAEDED